MPQDTEIKKTLNGKPLDLKSKQIQIDVNDKKDNQVVYTLKIKAGEIGKNDGDYTVKLLTNPNDTKSEFYTGSICIKIIDDALKVLNSNWPEDIQS